MRVTLRFSFLLLVVFATVVSCKKSVPKQTKYLPKDATFIFSVSPKSLQGKLANTDIKWDSLFQSLQTNMGDSEKTDAKKKWEDFKNSGIDLSADLYGFVSSTGSIMNGKNTSMAAVAVLKDASAFEAYIKKEKPGVTIKKEKNYSYAPLGNDFIAGWSDDVVIISMVSGGNFAEGTYNTGEGTASQKQLTTLFNQSESESVSSIPEFRELASQKSDMFFWTNSNSAIANIPMIGLTKAADLLKDAYGGSTLNFEDGKIEVKGISYVGKDLKEMFKKYAGPTIDYSMIEQYPSPVNGFAAFSFNPELITAILKFAGFDVTANDFVTKLGFTTDDIVKAFKGDFAIIFSDFSIVEKANPYSPDVKAKMPSAKLIFNAKVGDKAAYDKIVTQLAQKGLLVQQNGQYVPAQMGNSGFAASLDGKNILLASDSLLLQQYRAASGKANVPSDVKDKSKGKAIAFYVDINSILKGIPSDMSPSTSNSLMQAKETFKDIIATTENFDGKSMKGEWEIRTMNEKENSLVSLIKFFSAVSKEMKPVTPAYPGAGAMDSSMPAIDTAVSQPPAVK